MKLSKILSAAILSTALLVTTASAEKLEDVRMSDTWLGAKLDTTIALNQYISVFDINSDVRNQTAYLSGVVESQIEKDLAGEVAKSIDGITGVENDIKVDGETTRKSLEGNRSTRTFGRMIDDATATAVIKSKLFANSTLSALSINVDTQNGVATLRGKVSNEKEKALATKLAGNTSGITDVKDMLVIE